MLAASRTMAAGLSAPLRGPALLRMPIASHIMTTAASVTSASLLCTAIPRVAGGARMAIMGARLAAPRGGRRLAPLCTVLPRVYEAQGCGTVRWMTASPKKKARRAAERAAEAGLDPATFASSHLPAGVLAPEGFTVALVGRPNVGKSTLFNRLASRKRAIVTNIPGTTRDWKEADAKLGPLRFRLIDTGGLEEYGAQDLVKHQMRLHTATVLQNADVACYIIDGRSGITSLDDSFARWLRTVRKGKPTLLLVNKAERYLSTISDLDTEWSTLSAECYSLGFGDPIPVSAEHGDGMTLIADALLPYMEDALGDAAPLHVDRLTPEQAADLVAGRLDIAGLNEKRILKAAGAVRMAIVGRPNVGKSTLLNSMLGTARVVTGPMPGVTRDATEVEWKYDDRDIVLVDTAGMRRWGAWDLDTPLEPLAVAHSKRAIGAAHVVVLVIDATDGVTKQDMAIAMQVLEEGRPLVIALNKMDQAINTQRLFDHVVKHLEAVAVDAKGVTTVPVTALDGTGVGSLMPAVLRAFDAWNIRVSTGKLNRWLAQLARLHPPPSAPKTVVVRGSGRDKQQATKSLRLKLKFITQINTRPPTFALFTNHSDVPESYVRFLRNSLRDEFGLAGVPIRMVTRTAKNPFNKRKSQGRAIGLLGNRPRGTGGGTSSDVGGSGPSSGMRNQLRLRRLARRKLAAATSGSEAAPAPGTPPKPRNITTKPSALLKRARTTRRRPSSKV